RGTSGPAFRPAAIPCSESRSLQLPAIATAVQILGPCARDLAERAAGGKDTAPAAGAPIAPGVQRARATRDLGRGSVVEPVLDNPKPFIELVLDVPGGGRSEFAWEGRAPARPRCRGVAHPRYAWACAGCVVERVLDNPKPFIELVLDVPREGVQ